MKIISHSELTKKCYEKAFRFFISKIKEGDKILEIGAKWGNHADLITKKIPVNYKIYDLKDDRTLAKNIPFNIVDVSKDKFPDADKSFDVILISNVLEHIENISNFFRESHRVLKDGGLMLIDYPNFCNIFQRLIFLKNGIPTRLEGRLNNGSHVNFLPYKFLVQYLDKHFKLEEIKGNLVMDQIFFRKFFEKTGKAKFLISEKKTSPLFSHNIYLSFKKI